MLYSKVKGVPVVKRTKKWDRRKMGPLKTQKVMGNSSNLGTVFEKTLKLQRAEKYCIQISVGERLKDHQNY